MPIYEFKCQDCHTLFETIVSSATQLADVTCKKCQSRRVIKQISATCAHRPADSGQPAATGPASGCAARGGFS